MQIPGLYFGAGLLGAGGVCFLSLHSPFIAKPPHILHETGIFQRVVGFPSAFPASSPSVEKNKAIAFPVRLEIHLSQRKVILYKGTTPIRDYPIAVGRHGWETPTGEFHVMHMEETPTWINPLTGESIPGGAPDNPLGSYWIGFWTNGQNWIGFHGTPNPETVGRASSHGCIRMRNSDIEDLYSQVRVGTPVRVVN